MPTVKDSAVKGPSAKERRVSDAKRHAEEKKAKKLHKIAERRAKSHGLTKQEFIAQIVKGKYAPITADDIAAEPNPE